MVKSVLITGCTPGGIGHALAREFHTRGWRVFATARKTETILDLSNLGIETLSLEVTSEESIAALKDEITTRLHTPSASSGPCTATEPGTLDMLINNAGRNYTVPALDISMSEVRTTFETNLFSIILLCQTFTPLLLASHGTIVQIGSLAGIIPHVFGSVYNASKAALHAYSDTLRVELAPFGVRVVTVVTGGVISNISRTRRTLPEGSLYLPLAEQYEARQRHSQTVGIPNEVYARSVVEQLLRRPGRERIWEGGKAWLVWFVSTFLPRWVLDRAMTRMFQLWRLRGDYSKKNS